MRKPRALKAKKTAQSAGCAESMNRGVAPRQYLGFSLQHTRLMQLLLELPAGSTVSLEVIDDIALGISSGEAAVVQTKSTAESRNPISNGAADLWKTLANWVDLIRSGVVDAARTTFELYISAPRHGDVAERLASASTLDLAREALGYAHATLGHPGACSEEVSRHLNCVLKADDSIILPLIVNFRLTFGGGSPQEDLFCQFKNELIPDEIIEHVMHYAQGWVKRHVDLCLARSSTSNRRAEVRSVT